MKTQFYPVSYTHLRAHETVLDLVCRLLLENQKEHGCQCERGLIVWQGAVAKPLQGVWWVVMGGFVKYGCTRR